MPTPRAAPARCARASSPGPPPNAAACALQACGKEAEDIVVVSGPFGRRNQQMPRVKGYRRRLLQRLYPAPRQVAGLEPGLPAAPLRTGQPAVCLHTFRAIRPSGCTTPPGAKPLVRKYGLPWRIEIIRLQHAIALTHHRTRSARKPGAADGVHRHSAVLALAATARLGARGGAGHGPTKTRDGAGHAG